MVDTPEVIAYKTVEVIQVLLPQERVKEMLCIRKWQKMPPLGVLSHINVLICFQVESEVSL